MSDLIALNRGVNNSISLQSTPEGNPPKQSPRGYQVGSAGPTYRPTDLWDPWVSLSSLRLFSTALKIASMPFIQVGLIRGSRINATPYIYSPVPPLGEPS